MFLLRKENEEFNRLTFPSAKYEGFGVTECRTEAFLWIRTKSAESDHVSLDDHIGITSTHELSIGQTKWTGLRYEGSAYYRWDHFL